jgi:heme/copper-type cytochrome/quinol oxidase subunit 2
MFEGKIVQFLISNWTEKREEPTWVSLIVLIIILIIMIISLMLILFIFRIISERGRT